MRCSQKPKNWYRRGKRYRCARPDRYETLVPIDVAVPLLSEVDAHVLSKVEA
jgi:hypothetical protein